MLSPRHRVQGRFKGFQLPIFLDNVSFSPEKDLVLSFWSFPGPLVSQKGAVKGSKCYPLMVFNSVTLKWYIQGLNFGSGSC